MHDQPVHTSRMRIAAYIPVACYAVALFSHIAHQRCLLATRMQAVSSRFRLTWTQTPSSEYVARRKQYFLLTEDIRKNVSVQRFPNGLLTLYKLTTKSPLASCRQSSSLTITSGHECELAIIDDNSEGNQLACQPHLSAPQYAVDTRYGNGQAPAS